MNEELKHYFSKWVSLLANILVWLVLFCGFVLLILWSAPRQPAFIVFNIILVLAIMLLSQWKPSWAVFLTILVIPGITTSSVTIFNKLSSGPNIGVFGPAALFPALSLILGVWFRTIWKREKIASTPLTKLLLFFVGISAASAIAVLWRYSNFWPFNFFYDPVLNVAGEKFSTVYSKIIWTFTNYFTGPFLLLAVCQAAYISRRKSGDGFCARKWILNFIIFPVFLGSAAVFYVGWKQVYNVWFGANKFYIWPWVNRINATFFDPNALGSYIILIVPWILASIFLLYSIRRWLAIPGAALGAFLLWRCGTLISHSGSRISILGVIIILTITILFGLLLFLNKIKSRLLFRISAAAVFILYFSSLLWLFYASPKIVNYLVEKHKIKNSSLLERVKKLPLGSFKGIYKQVMKDRGPYAELAISMIKSTPLTGVGLGSFTTEYSNWKQLNKTLIYVPDTACNYYLQVASEQGLIALVAILVFFVLWWKVLWKVRQTERAFGFWFFIGAGVASMMVIFIFGMHTLANEIQCLFWIFLSQPLIAYKEEEEKPRRSNKFLYILFLSVSAAYFCNAASYLSLDRQKEKFNLKNREGFYKWENWAKSRIKHTRKKAKETIKCQGIVFRQSWACLHPDITTTPVTVTFSLDNFSTNITVSDNEWKQLFIKVPFDKVYQFIDYEIEASRSWSGKKFNINDDRREIGLTLKEEKWLYSDGLYNLETWPQDGCPAQGKNYNWTQKRSGILERTKGNYCNLMFMTAHPDVTQTPVVATIRFGNDIIEKVKLTNTFWYNKTYLAKPYYNENNFYLEINVNRTWCPTNYGQVDSRNLGIALVEPEMANDVGFYHEENWRNRFQYKWAGKYGRWAQKSNLDGKIIVDYLISNPDIKEKPVKWTLFVDKEKVCSQTITNTGWFSYELVKEPETWHDLEAETDREWNPLDFGNQDNRKLGFAVKIQ